MYTIQNVGDFPILVKKSIFKMLLKFCFTYYIGSFGAIVNAFFLKNFFFFIDPKSIHFKT